MDPWIALQAEPESELDLLEYGETQALVLRTSILGRPPQRLILACQSNYVVHTSFPGTIPPEGPPM